MKEKPPLILKRTPRGLEAGSKLALDILSKYDIGSYVEVSIKQRRSSPQNAAYWAMLEKVIEATGAYPRATDLHEALKMDLNYTTPIKTLSGDVFLIPDSTAFARMDSADFRAFFAAAEKRIGEQFGIDASELRKEAA